MGTKVSQLTGVELRIDVDLYGVFRVRCMNCGKPTRFVITYDGGHICCALCQCILADREAPTEADMTQVRWEV